MSTRFIVPLDPLEIDERFSIHDSFNHRLRRADHDFTKKGRQADDLKALTDEQLARLPEEEQDLLRCYFFRDMTQLQLSRIFDRTQPAIGYKIEKAQERLKHVYLEPDITDQDLKDFLVRHPYPDSAEPYHDMMLMFYMYQITSYTQVGIKLGIGQGSVYYRCKRYLKYLTADENRDIFDEEELEIVDTYQRILDRPSILHTYRSYSRSRSNDE